MNMFSYCKIITIVIYKFQSLYLPPHCLTKMKMGQPRWMESTLISFRTARMTLLLKSVAMVEGFSSSLSCVAFNFKAAKNSSCNGVDLSPLEDTLKAADVITPAMQCRQLRKDCRCYVPFLYTTSAARRICILSSVAKAIKSLLCPDVLTNCWPKYVT